MAIEQHEGGTTFTGEHIGAFAIHAKVGRLAMACRFGPRPGELEGARIWCGTDKRTSKGVLEDFVLWMYGGGMALGAQWSTVKRALGDDRAAKLRRKCEKVAK